MVRWSPRSVKGRRLAGRRAGLLALVFLLTAVMLVGLFFSAIVAERSREIGLLMALGSRGRHVVQMFLAEASVTTALGGLLGVGVGAGLLLVFRRSVGYAASKRRGSDSSGRRRRRSRRSPPVACYWRRGSVCWARPSPRGMRAGARPYGLIRSEVH